MSYRRLRDTVTVPAPGAPAASAGGAGCGSRRPMMRMSPARVRSGSTTGTGDWPAARGPLTRHGSGAHERLRPRDVWSIATCPSRDLITTT